MTVTLIALELSNSSEVFDFKELEKIYNSLKDVDLDSESLTLESLYGSMLMMSNYSIFTTENTSVKALEKNLSRCNPYIDQSLETDYFI
jgi:hypothetical protein